MRQLRLTVGSLTVAAAMVLALSGNVDAKVRKGDRVAKLSNVTDGAKKKISLKKHKKKVIVLTFGASWCAPCKAELPALEKLAAKYAGKKIVFIAVNVDKERAAGEKFMKEAGLKKVIAAYDTKKSAVDSFDPPTMPSTFIIRDGIVRKVHKGYRKGDDKKLDKLIASELSKL